MIQYVYAQIVIKKLISTFWVEPKLIYSIYLKNIIVFYTIKIIIHLIS